MYNLTEEEETQLKEVYDELNGEENGGLKVDQLLNMAQIFGLNVSKDEVQKKLEEFDSDQDGDLDFEELKKLVESLYTTKEERCQQITESMKIILQSYDLGEGEYLSKGQLGEFLMGKGDDPLIPDQIDEIFASLDKDGDDRISAAELAALFEEDYQQEAL